MQAIEVESEVTIQDIVQRWPDRVARDLKELARLRESYARLRERHSKLLKSVQDAVHADDDYLCR